MSFLQDAVPFFVNATAGTTVQGAFDPLNRIADISERNGIWMHVDVRVALRNNYAIQSNYCLSMHTVYACASTIYCKYAVVCT